MHNSILLVLWGGLSFILYKLVNHVREEVRHRRNAQRLGCEPAHSLQGRWDFFGIQTAFYFVKHINNYSLLQYNQDRVEALWKKEGRVIPTLYQEMAGIPMLLVLDPKNVQTVLATKFKDFGLGDFRHNLFAPLLGSGIFTTDGEQWSHARALLRPQFARDQISDLDLEEKHIRHLFRRIPINSDQWTDVVNIQPLFFRLTLDTATEFLFGESVNSQFKYARDHISEHGDNSLDENDFANAFDKAQSALSEASAYGPRFYWLRYGKEFRQHVKICHDFIDHFVHNTLSKEKTSTGITSSGKKKFVFLDAVAESTRDPIELRNHMINILLAGRDTTASALSYVFLELSRHPDIYAKLHAIIRERFGTYRNPRDITFESLKACNYLQWTIQETLRLYPVVPFDARQCLQDTTLPTGGGPDGTKPIYVRKGTELSYPLHITHRRKDIWGEDANEFKPERFEGRKTGWEYLPFNGGPRICIGQQFALTEAAYVIVRLLQRFEKCEGVGNSWEPVEKGGYGFVRSRISLTASPADGVKVRFQEAAD